MTQENAEVNKLIAARERMIQDRRKLADALACEYKDGHTERMRDSFIIAKIPSRPSTALLLTRRSWQGKSRDR
jgi:hypothetical protein